jgi:hypothetical protein
MSAITAEEAATYRKIIDDAIEKLRESPYKNHRSPRLFWTDYNNNNDDDDDDHATDHELLREIELRSTDVL